jgi:hypothetical protein
MINTSDYSDTPEMRQVIFEAFITRVKSLIKQYRESRKSALEQEVVKKQRQKYERKVTVSVSQHLAL